MSKRKLINVDFQRLERQSYRTLSGLGKEIVDAMIKANGDPEPDLTAYQKAMWDMVKESMKSLTERQLQVLTMYFGLDGSEPCTERAVAKKLGIDRNTVQDIKARAIKKLRKLTILNEKVLKSLNSQENDEKSEKK